MIQAVILFFLAVVNLMVGIFIPELKEVSSSHNIVFAMYLVGGNICIAIANAAKELR